MRGGSAHSGSGAGGVRSAAAVALALTLTAIATNADLSAHRLDEFLQAARIGIAPDGVELQLDLTPGVAVAGTIIADIDSNRDGSLSPDEQQAYAARVLNAITLDVDGQSIQLRPGVSHFPDVDAFKRGEGTIALIASANLPHLSNGTHQLSYKNTHRRDVSVYLANALVPDSDRIAIRDQLRDSDQRDLTIDYVLRDEQDISLARAWLVAWIAAAAIGALLLRRSSRSSRSTRGYATTGS